MPTDRRNARGTPVLAPILLALVSITSAATVPVDADDASDPAAVEVAERVLEAMGGARAWEATRYLRFDFAGRRSHAWDRQTGRHRMETTTREGERILVLHNLDSREGRAFADGEEVSGERLAELLEMAYAAWINDTYWLVMPYKMRDPGVTLRYEGTETIDGVAYDKVLLTFDGVGLTPGDRYWAYVNRETGLMDRWAYHLESYGPDDAPTHWLWQGWRTYGAIRLAPLRVMVDGGRELSLAPIEVPDELPDSLFTSP